MASRFESPEQFVRAYMEAYKNGESLEDLAKRFGTTHKSILAKTGKFRAVGVKLPRLKTARDIDIAKLNSIVADVMKEVEQSGESNDPEPELTTRKCVRCNEIFTPTNQLQKYCAKCRLETNPRSPEFYARQTAAKELSVVSNVELPKKLRSDFDSQEWEKRAKESDAKIAALGWNRK